MPQEEVIGLNPTQAMEKMQQDPRAVLIDIRSNMEYLFVGHPVGAVHIPWIDEPDWMVNPDFVRQVRQTLLGGVCEKPGSGCAPVILICRSGKRSLEAGRKLIESGMSEVYHVDEGFEGDLDASHHRSSMGGWRFHGLPWEQC